MIDFLGQVPASTASGGFRVAWEFLIKGGIFMVPLVLTSVAGMMAIVYKFLSLSRRRVIPYELARKLEQMDAHASPEIPESLIGQIGQGQSTLERLAYVVLKNRSKPRSEITQAVESAAREEIVHLHAGISVIDTIITIAPLLGLLGTASGLVTIFQGLSDTTDHVVIARGISEALTTTIAGLAIAVPCVVAHGYFVRRIEMLTARLESLLSNLTSACENSNA